MHNCKCRQGPVEAFLGMSDHTSKHSRHSFIAVVFGSVIDAAESFLGFRELSWSLRASELPRRKVYP